MPPMPSLSYIARVWSSPWRGVLLVYGLLGVALWFVPLFNLLHAESSAVVAGVAFFVAGLSSLGLFRQGRRPLRVLGGQVAALLVPWALLTVTLAWVPNCGYLEGLLFFLLFPPVSIVLAVALAYALYHARVRRKKTTFVVIGLALVVLTPLYDLGLHPQFYTYNHVFGGVLGPIYDEELALRPGLVVFRGMTLLWAASLFWVGTRLEERGRGGERERKENNPPYPLSPFLPLLAVLLLGGGYLFADRLGINTSAAAIQRALGGHHRTAHFDIYYDPASIEETDLLWIAADHEYRYASLIEQLGMAVPKRVASYLYPDPDVKARLTGARYTNVAPVWLRQPQTHVLLDFYTQVFPHELAHVFSREFGLPVLNASVAVGLVEGFAVAVEPPDGLPTPHEQVSVVAVERRLSGVGAASLADDLASRFSPFGFWTGRGAVSYTTMGSFVRYLLDAYGAERFKQVYATANFEAVYGKPVEALAAEWVAFVEALPHVDRSAGTLTRRRFSRLSIFEKPCPHYVPRYRRVYQQGEAALAAEDTVLALSSFDEALLLQPRYEPALAAWARLTLAGGDAEAVVTRLDTVNRVAQLPSLTVPLGDAYAVLGQPLKAKALYDSVLVRLPAYAAETTALLVMRKSLAPYPDLVRTLTAGGNPAVQARLLEAGADTLPAARMMAALRWAEAHAFEQAAALLRNGSLSVAREASVAEQGMMHRQWLVWLAQAEARAGAYAEAATTIQQALPLFQQAGDFNAMAQGQDFYRKIAWLGAQE